VVLRVGGSKYGPDCAGEGGTIMLTMQTIMMVTITTRIIMPITTTIHIMMNIINIMMTNTIQTLSRPLKLVILWLMHFMRNPLKRSRRLFFIMMMIRTDAQKIHTEILFLHTIHCIIFSRRKN